MCIDPQWTSCVLGKEESGSENLACFKVFLLVYYWDLATKNRVNILASLTSFNYENIHKSCNYNIQSLNRA